MITRFVAVPVSWLALLALGLIGARELGEAARALRAADFGHARPRTRATSPGKILEII
jgi:hypothetical protein